MTGMKIRLCRVSMNDQDIAAPRTKALAAGG
jgi:hypothetical protein